MLPAHQRDPAVQQEVTSGAAVTRKALDPAYRTFKALYDGFIAALTRLSERDGKHGARFLMENLSFVQPHAADLADVVPDFALCHKDLQGNLKRSEAQYVDQQLQHSKLWPLLLLAGKLHVLLKDVSAGDIRFQVHLTPLPAA